MVILPDIISFLSVVISFYLRVRQVSVTMVITCDDTCTRRGLPLMFTCNRLDYR